MRRASVRGGRRAASVPAAAPASRSRAGLRARRAASGCQAAATGPQDARNATTVCCGRRRRAGAGRASSSSSKSAARLPGGTGRGPANRGGVTPYGGGGGAAVVHGGSAERAARRCSPSPPGPHPGRDGGCVGCCRAHHILVCTRGRTKRGDHLFVRHSAGRDVALVGGGACSSKSAVGRGTWRGTPPLR